MLDFTRSDWAAHADALRFRNHAFIDDKFVDAVSCKTFDSEDESVAMANDSSNGLAASAWTNDPSHACRVSFRLHAVTVSVNTGDALAAHPPFRGMKQSGFGRDRSLRSLEKYTALKTTWIMYKP